MPTHRSRTLDRMKRAAIRHVVLLPGLALALALHGVAANELGGQDCTDLGGQPINFNVDWQTQVKPILNTLFGGRCTGCHDSNSMLDLTDENADAIYNLFPGDPNPEYVVPGRPQASILFDKINCDDPGWGGLRMPFLEKPLTLEQQGLIYDWIAQGALGEPEAGTPIARDFVFRDGIESLR